MKTTELKERAAQVKEKTTELMKGDFTLKGLDFFLLGAICLLAGICIGLLTAPLTQGVGISVFSNNGSNNSGNGCHNGNENGNNRTNVNRYDDLEK